MPDKAHKEAWSGWVSLGRVASGALAVVNVANASDASPGYDVEIALDEAPNAGDAERCGGALGAFQYLGLPGLPNPLRLGPLRKSAITTAMLAPPPPGHASSNATVVAFLHVDDGDCAFKARARANPNPDPPVALSHN